jgi:hypothetical protein
MHRADAENRYICKTTDPDDQAEQDKEGGSRTPLMFGYHPAQKGLPVGSLRLQAM